ncbi:MAG: type II and III secretion system protein family protein [Deltaproteobacteria bacterium]|nr:MAG: type II and III secretion system protein family protein [Deltaproteobacteria bacterium]
MNFREGVRGVVTRKKVLFIAVSMLCLGLLGVPAHALPEPDAAKAPATSLSLYANQSVVLDTPFDIKRVSIARPETADVMVVSPRQIVVIGKSAGTTTLVYWSREEVPNKVEVVVGINLEIAKEDLQKIAPGETFEVTAAGDKLILTGTVSDNVVQTRLVEGAQAYAKGIVNLLKVKKLEQVLLQIRVSEIDRTLAKELGFNFLFLGNSHLGGISPPNNFNPLGGDPRVPSLGNGLTDQLTAFITKPGLKDFAVFMRALDDKGGVKLLAEPNLVVANGAEGKFLVGGEFPVVISTGSTGTSSFSVVYKEYGVRLGFQPKISPNGEIYLHVAQEVSELDFVNAVVLSGFRIPALKTRKAESGLQLADGQTFVLAGLLDNKVSKQVSKIPLLGDIPILGALFRSTRYTNNETELMVMITPKLVRSLDKEEIPTLPTERMKPEETSPDMIW